MSSHQEKLSILSEMISFAKIDKEVKDVEYDFLLNVAQQLDISKKIFDALFNQEVVYVVPKTEADRIVQFHRLVLLMNIDNSQELIEINKLFDIGLKMGLPQGAIQQVLSVMHTYENRIIPTDILINIFKAYHN